MHPKQAEFKLNYTKNKHVCCLDGKFPKPVGFLSQIHLGESPHKLGQ